MLLILLTRLVFESVSIGVCFRVKNNVNALKVFRSLCSISSVVGVFGSFLASKDKEERHVWFAVSIRQS